MYGKVSDGLMPVLLMAEQQLPDGEERGDSMYWREVDVVKRLLRHAVPRHLTRRNEVAIAGSAALHWYQGQTNVGPLWTDIGDIDIFVAGPNGSTEANFKDFVLSIVQRFEAAHHVVESVECYKCLVYGPTVGGDICICDVMVRDISVCLSFVQSPGCLTARSVMEKFDIDICQVMYDIHRQTFELSVRTRANIRAGTAVALPLLFESDDGNVSLGDMIRVRKTLLRMRKHHARGYVFGNGGGVRFGSDEGANPAARRTGARAL